MSNPNYSLEIISHHPTFKNKSLRKYYVDGIDTIGAWGDEPFEIKFTNHTWQKVQVKISVDGTDVLSGELATTEPTKDMWVVNGYATMSLKAWPETNNGGAQLVFTSGSNSVALHTHGDMSNRGIIAAAVFTEGHVEPIKLNPPVEHHHHHYDRIRRSITPVYPVYPVQPVWIGDYTLSDNTGGSFGGTYGSNVIGGTAAGSAGQLSFNTCSMNAAEGSASNFLSSQANGEAAAASLQSLAAVGAGQHVDQKINYVAGLIKPLFSETVRVKYMWWDELVSKLREHNVPVPHPSGFPGDKKQTNINLGNTPRIGEFGRAFPRERPAPVPVQSYLRV
jgi:hypothetical protein